MEQNRRIKGVREHVLPTGEMHLVFRFSSPPLRLYREIDDLSGYCIGDAVVGGVRSSFYVKDAVPWAEAVGVQFSPGVSESLFGVRADELVQRHTRLEDLWGREAELAREQIGEVDNPVERLECLESILLHRLSKNRILNPAVSASIELLKKQHTVREIVERSGYSHRHFIDLFKRYVGLPPKSYARIVRFKQALRQIPSERSWVSIALNAGYSDQAHFCRDFVKMTGLTPSDYRLSSPRFPNHVYRPR